MEIAIA